jgi:hypothetical protein
MVRNGERSCGESSRCATGHGETHGGVARPSGEAGACVLARVFYAGRMRPSILLKVLMIIAGVAVVGGGAFVGFRHTREVRGDAEIQAVPEAADTLREEDLGAYLASLRAQARQMFHWWHRVRDGTLSHASFASYMRPIRREVERLLEAGQTCGVPKTEGTCRDILKRRQALWTFMRHEGVEPTNNAAERAIRLGVLWRKGSFGTQSPEGSRFVETMMTVVATLKQQHRHVLTYITAACEAALRGEAAPSLLPTPTATEELLCPAA